ncbi:hypothetical protein FAMCQIZV_CDS0003 [Phage C72C1]|nr:hypothetical protein FAMCQIZV_CDS0003 [Phage C72C1]
MNGTLRDPSQYIGAPGSQAFMQALQQPRPAVGPTIGALPPAPSVAIPRRPQPQAQRPLMPLEQAVMNQAMRQSPMAGLAQQQRQKPPAGGIMGMLPGIDTPGGAGLSAAAARGLQLSGYQDRPITTGQVLGEMMGAGMEAYRAAQAGELEKKLTEAKIAEAQAKSGLPYQGTSMDAQDRNIVLSLSDKVARNEATPTEMAQYRMSLSRLNQPKTIRSYGPNGEEIITQTPPVDVGGVFIPDDMKPDLSETKKPTALQQSQKKRIGKLNSSASQINKYRRAIMSAKASGLYSGVGRAGELFLPSEEMVELQNLATEIRLSIKDMEELGALVGGDFAILAALVEEPNSPNALRLGPDILLKQLDNLEERLADRITEAQNLAGVDTDFIRFQGTFRMPYEVSSADDVAGLPANSYFIAKDDPSGSVRFKPAL